MNPTMRATTRTTLLLLLLLLLATAGRGLADIAPVGSEFQVNTYTTGPQSSPAVNAAPGGTFVVVWSSGTYSVTQDGSRGGVFGQRYDGDGSKLGGEFQVNVYTTGPQTLPSVALTGSGAFVVAWQSGYYFGPGQQDGSGSGAFLRLFDATGAPLGEDVQANTYVTNAQQDVAVAADGGGNFVVVWQSQTQDGSGAGIFGQRFDSAGSKVGGEFQVNTYTTSGQYAPAVAIAPSGDFVVTWTSGGYYGVGQDGSGNGVFARRFTSAGAPLGPEFQVNVFTTGSQSYPAVGSAPDGGFVVAWQSRSYPVSQDGSGGGVFARRFDAAGTPAGSDFQVNTYTRGEQGYPAVAVDGAGRFVVAWRSGGYYGAQDGSSGGVFAQHFAITGERLGPELQVNTYTTGDQSTATVAADSSGRFVVAWRGSFYPGQDGASAGVFAQRFKTTAKQPAIPMPGTHLLLKDDPTDATRKGVTARASDASINLGLGNGSEDDPTLTGGRVRLRSAGFDDTYELPAANWRYLGTPGQNQGYVYRDRALLAGPIRLVKVRMGKVLSLSGRGAQLGHGLGGNPDPVLVVVQTGDTGQRYCMTFGGTTTYKPDATFRAKGAPAVPCPL